MADTFVSKLAHKAYSAHKRLENLKEKSEAAMGVGLMVLEANAAAFAWAYANGRWGASDKGKLDDAIDVFGIPADLGVGVVLLGLGLFGGFGKYGEHACFLSTGSLASFSVRMGTKMGKTALSQTSGAHAWGREHAGAFGAAPAWGHSQWRQPQHAAAYG